MEDFEGLYEIVSDEFPVDRDIFNRDLSDLVDIGLVVRNVNTTIDQVWFSGKPGLKYTDVAAFDNRVKQLILFQFITNPATFFILFNTQKGKSSNIQKKITSWANEKEKQIVTIVMLDNDATLGDQSTEGLVARMKINGVKVKLFQLVSSSKTSINEIIAYIDCYAAYPGDPEYPMPLITALTNSSQLEKVLRVLNRVVARHSRNPNLLYAMIWDEADKTYTQVRDKMVNIDGSELCIRNFTLDDTDALHGNGFVTASEGSLIDDYPECSSAHAVIPEINENDERFYRAIHHKDAIVKIIKISNKQKNNQTFLYNFDRYNSHFMEKTLLNNGELGFRKTIINSNTRVDDMKSLAGDLIKAKCHAIVFNQTGIMAYNCYTGQSKRFKTKGRYFNELLFYAYKKCNLDTAPLFIIGRRKVDRGLGFHYAPRNHNEVVPKTLDFDNMGIIQTDGIEGLIWTDEFLGHIEVKETAVQKAGRLAGITAQCPQYPKNGLTWWTDEETASVIKYHNEIVDSANKLSGCMTMGQALDRASREVPVITRTIEDLSPIDYDWCGRGLATPYEAFDSLDALNIRKKELNSRAHDQQLGEPDEDGFYLSAMSGAPQKLTTADINGFKKISSNLPKNHDKLKKGEITMRVYVFYNENETDPNKFRLALRWVRRITEVRSTTQTNAD
jgi:hypothetical protein